MREITLTRTSVCAGDSIGAPHRQTIEVNNDIWLSTLLIMVAGYLPRIGGDHAWLVCADRVLGYITGDAFGGHDTKILCGEHLISDMNITDIHCKYYTDSEWDEFRKEVLRRGS